MIEEKQIIEIINKLNVILENKIIPLKIDVTKSTWCSLTDKFNFIDYHLEIKKTKIDTFIFNLENNCKNNKPLELRLPKKTINITEIISFCNINHSETYIKKQINKYVDEYINSKLKEVNQKEIIYFEEDK